MKCQICRAIIKRSQYSWTFEDGVKATVCPGCNKLLEKRERDTAFGNDPAPRPHVHQKKKSSCLGTLFFASVILGATALIAFFVMPAILEEKEDLPSATLPTPSIPPSEEASQKAPAAPEEPAIALPDPKPPAKGSPEYWHSRYEKTRIQELANFRPRKVAVEMISGRKINGVVKNIDQSERTVLVKTDKGAEAELPNTALSLRTRVAFFRDDYASWRAKGLLKAEMAKQEAQEQEQIEKEVDEMIDQMIASTFTTDGRHRNVERIVKSRLHDPSSYEHVSTTHRVGEEWVHVVMQYRAKNKLGAPVLEKVVAEADAFGNVVGLKVVR